MTKEEAEARTIPILMYHHVSPTPGLVTVSPVTFHAQMACLAKHGYRSISSQDLANFLAGKKLPDKSVVITFDDGYLDNYLYAHPILQKFGFRAILFLITGWIGNGPPRPLTFNDKETLLNVTHNVPSHRACMEKISSGFSDEVMLRWSEISAMHTANTFEFHSHTHSHHRWDLTINDRKKRLMRLMDDLCTSRIILLENTGITSTHLCWPQGYFDFEYQSVAQNVGFSYLYTTEKGTCFSTTPTTRIPRIAIRDRADEWLIRRLWVYRHPSLARAYLKINSLHSKNI